MQMEQLSNLDKLDNIRTNPLEKLKDCEEFRFLEELNFGDIDLNIDFDLDSIEFPEIDFDFSFFDEEVKQQ